MSNSNSTVNTMSMLRLCALDPPKYGWTACGGVASILEPHEMARRQEAKESFLKRQREEAAAARKEAAAAAAGADGEQATTNDKNDKKKEEANIKPKYYTITDPAAEAKEKAKAATAKEVDADDDKKPAAETKDAKKEDDKIDKEAKQSTTPLKQITIHATPKDSTTLDIYTYHRGRVGQEPRHSKTGELLCDTDPIDTNHCWVPPKTTVKITIKFPLEDPYEEEYVDSDLDEDDDIKSECGIISGGEKDASSPGRGGGGLERGESFNLGRASRVRTTRGASIGGSSAAINPQQMQNIQPTKTIPYFIDTIFWDLANPSTPTPEEYAANIASKFGLSFPQTMDLKESIEKQLRDFARSQPHYFAPIALLDPYGSERPNSHFGPPELHCGPVLGASLASGGASKPSLIRRQTSSFAGSASRGGGGDGRSSSSRSDRPRGAVKPDKKGIHIVPKNDLPIPGEGCIYSAEILKRAKAKSSAECAAAAARGEVVLEVLKEEVCHICHNRKAVVLNFCCGNHGYCDFHCASRLGFRAKDFDKENPTNLPIDYCPVCTLHCTCSKCKRRLEGVASKMKAVCQKQCCEVGDVVMDDLYDLCSSKLAGEKNKSKPPSSTKKGGSAKKKSDGEGGTKRRRSEEGESEFGPRQSISRSTRSSPLLDESDARSKKKQRLSISAPGKPVLKVRPQDFPKEMFVAKDLDPSTPEDMNTIFTPDGIFPVEPNQASGLQGTEQKYQDTIEISHDLEKNWSQCAICNGEIGEERICCLQCPRAYDKKCFDQLTAKDAELQGRGCRRCVDDLMVKPEEDIETSMVADDKIVKAFDKAKYNTSSYTFSGIVLSQLLHILDKLLAYDYGFIFAYPVNLKEVGDYLNVIKRPMDYGTIAKKLSGGEYAPEPDGPSSKGEMDAMEEIVLLALKDITQVHHNCLLYNAHGSVYYKCGEVMDKKWRSYFDKHIKDRLPEVVQSSLTTFQEACEKERNETNNKRHFQVQTKSNSQSRAIAVFDPDTKMIVKQYTAKTSAKLAALILHGAGYECEYELHQTNAKTKLENAEDPQKSIFGYQWIPMDKLKAGEFKVKPFFREDNLLSPTPTNIVILKEDTVSGVQKVRGFHSEESAYQDWLSEKSVSFNTSCVEDDKDTKSDFGTFVKNYLDGEQSINGCKYSRQQPSPVAEVPKSPGKVVMEEEKAPATPKKMKVEES